jgi:hypothetical protein
MITRGTQTAKCPRVEKQRHKNLLCLEADEVVDHPVFLHAQRHDPDDIYDANLNAYTDHIDHHPDEESKEEVTSDDFPMVQND